MNFLLLRKLFSLALLPIVLFFLLLTPSPINAAEIVWEVYDPSNLAKGYKVYYRLSTEQFESSIDVGNILSYKIEDLNIPFQPEETYYFAVSVYTDSAESPLSDEVSYTHQSLTTEDIDSDGDGLKDDEETTLYYTDPYNSDTDGDNISDGDEVANDTDPLTPQPTVTLLTPDNGATIPIGETILSCQAKSPNCDISHISLYSDISGTFQLDSTYYAEEIVSPDGSDLQNLTAEFPVLIANDGLYNWNCQAYGVNGSSAMGPTDFSLTANDSEVTTIIFEDAEDGSVARWSIEDENTTNTISNTTSPDRPGQVIEFSGSPSVANKLNTFSFTNTEELDSFNLSWSHKFQDYFIIKINMSTSQGEKTLFYWPGDMTFITGAGNSIFIGLGNTSANGVWQSFTRNLREDVRQIEAINTLISLDKFNLYGNGQIDDIKIDLNHSAMSN